MENGLEEYRLPGPVIVVLGVMLAGVVGVSFYDSRLHNWFSSR